MRRFARGVGIAVAMMGCLVLAGWALDITVLKSIAPGLLTMKANTAFAFVLGGVSLWIHGLPGEPTGPMRTAQRACAAGVVLIGALTLSEHLCRWDLGVDCLVFKDVPSAIETSPPGRMCPATSLALVCSGSALLVLGLERALASQLLALATILIGSSALLGYVFDARSLYDFPPWGTVGLNTAGTELLLSLGILAARPDQAILARLTGDTAGAAIARRLLPAAFLVPVLLGRFALSGEHGGGAAMTTAISAMLNMLVLATLIWWTTGRSNREEEARRTSEERLCMATDAARVGLWFWDLVTDRVECTPTCRELLGGSSDAHCEAIRGALRLCDGEHALEDEAERALEHRVVWPDGSVHWVALRGRTFHEAGRPISKMGVVVDITERKQVDLLREELLSSERAARATVERTGRMKDEFLQTLSHELRTPLTAILGWAQIARTRQDREAMSECLAVIERNARLQERLVEDLLDMSRITSGKLHLDMRPVDLASIVEMTMETTRPAADAKEIRRSLRVDLPPRGGIVDGDPDRLQQIVRNLLSNAVKFTPRGGSVDVVLRRTGAKLELRVSDTGQGIAAEFLPSLFERFQQADGSMTRKHGGLGLGLAIVHELVQLHRGSVDAASAGAGRGASFTVRLPAIDASFDARADHVAASAAIAEEDRKRLRDVKILVVDDDADTCGMVRRLLEECAARVTTALTPSQALAEFARGAPDVLVSDIGMPDVDGFELIRRVRALEGESTSRVPAIALTAFVRPEDRARALRHGYQVFLPKPIECSRLIRTIAELAPVARAPA